MQHLPLDGRTDFFEVIASTPRSQAAVMTLPPGQSTGGPDNTHDHADQWLYIRFGQGKATVNGQTLAIGPGDLLLIEANEPHEIAAGDDGPLVTFSVYAPKAY